MVEYIPDAIRKYPLSIAIALIPLLIINLFTSPILQNPDNNVTVMEIKNQTSGLSHVNIIIQNVGKAASENLLVYLASDNPFKLISYDTTDLPPKQIGDDGKLRINIERLAPQSIIILNTEGKISTHSKTVWVSSKEETKILTLPYNTTDTGISSINFSIEHNLGNVIILIFSAISLVVFRYINFYKSESKRRDYLGVYSIRIVRYGTYLTLGFLIIAGGFIMSIAIDTYLNPLPTPKYSPYTTFSLKDTDVSRFIEINNPATPVYGSVGIMIQIIVLAVVLSISNRDIHLPKFDWSLKPTQDMIKLHQITSSYLKSRELSMSTKIDLSKKDAEIFVVKNKENVVGLFSMKEIEIMKLHEKTNPRSIFRNKKLPTPKLDETNYTRNNFVIVEESISLEVLKQKMENILKKYAIIKNSKNEFVGVVDYDDLFGKPDILKT